MVNVVAKDIDLYDIGVLISKAELYLSVGLKIAPDMFPAVNRMSLEQLLDVRGRMVEQLGEGYYRSYEGMIGILKKAHPRVASLAVSPAISESRAYQDWLELNNYPDLEIM